MSERLPPGNPLRWPAGWQRTDDADRTYGRFSRKNARGWQDRLSVSDALGRLDGEMHSLGVETWIITTDLPLRQDGFPRSGSKQPEDPGVSAYWVDADGQQRCMATDQYLRVADNIAAIAATLNAMRAIERHGGGVILQRAFVGFQALPNLADEEWFHFLGYQSPSDLHGKDIEAMFRSEIQKVHPDKGGDDWAINRALKARARYREWRDMQ
ncbi:MAG: J domain-containing protein [Pseudomonadota bacterium]